MDKKYFFCRDKKLSLSGGCLIAGILNLTPDSFSDGGLFLEPERALEQARQMVSEGADVIDVGGESSRPGARPVSVREELSRVMPVIKQLVPDLKVPISVDTYKYEVARSALEAGVDIINDITGLGGDVRLPGLLAQHKAGVVIMHMKGAPQTMQLNPEYGDIIEEITDFLKQSLAGAVLAGVPAENVIVDPGLGFGKKLEHNLEIIRRLSCFKGLGCPVLIGPSRKSFIGQILDVPVQERLEGTLAAVAMCLINGADIVRVHDVKQVKRTVKMIEALL